MCYACERAELNRTVFQPSIGDKTASSLVGKAHFRSEQNFLVSVPVCGSNVTEF